jgi:antitoxin component YwqK of YwqJK toxin-antitoxin module
LEKWWWGNGIMGSTSHYKNGKKNGLRKVSNEKGKLTFQGNFVDGVVEIK